MRLIHSAMRRALNILGVVALTTLITYLWMINNFAEERAARLERALANAEARASSLEADFESAARQLAELKRNQELRLRTVSSSHQPSAVASTILSGQSEVGGVITTASSSAGTTSSPGANSMQRFPGPWYSYAFFSSPGVTNFVRVEGTSSIHNWQVESHLINGFAQFGPGLLTPGAKQVRHPDIINANVSVFIPVRSLKSVEANGMPYSDRMDEIMYEKLRAGTYSRITWTLTSLTLREQSDVETRDLVYDAVGQLSLAGQTNTITMPVSVTPGPDGKTQFAGSVQIKMSDFKISPPAPSFDGIPIKTGDDVRLSFAWWVKPVNTIAAIK